MIISHQHKFIFLKTNKTAGTSMEIALSKFCGPDDVITRIEPEDEKTRRTLGYRGPQNYLAPFADYAGRDWLRLLTKRRRKRRYFSHSGAWHVREHIGEQVWNSYFKFCFERNPWDRIISHYYWRCRSEPRPTMAEFLESDAPLLLKRSGYQVYTISGEVAVDKICRYENLAEELENIRTQLGIPEPLELPRAKSQFRVDKRRYSEILSEAEGEKIADMFREEIDLLGNKF